MHGERGKLPVVRGVAWTVSYLGLGFGLMLGLFTLLAPILLGPTRRPGEIEPGALLLQTLCGFAAFGVATALVGFKALRLGWRDLRWSPATGAGGGFARGLAIGAAAASGTILLSLVLGHAAFVREQGSLAGYLAGLGASLLLLAPAALLEEVVFRGVGQVALAQAIGRRWAVIALSVVFALAHTLNPNATPLGILNVGLAGVLLGFVFYMPGGIWAAWGAHIGWNGALTAFDAPVSGMPFRIPLFDYQAGGPAWLTGGGFGPEGGVLASSMIVLTIMMARRWAGKELA